MKFNVSIMLNLLLILALAWLGNGWLTEGFNHHYHKEHTGFVPHEIEQQTRNGNPELVQKNLHEPPQPPSYKELVEAERKLESEPAKLEGS